MADVRYLRAEVVSLNVTVDGVEQNDTFDASESSREYWDDFIFVLGK